MMMMIKMDLKDRIILYLKTRQVPVSREELLSIAVTAGADHNYIYSFVQALQNNPSIGTVNIGVWYGFEKNNRPDDGEKKTVWMRFYPMKQKTKEAVIASLKYFDSK